MKSKKLENCSVEIIGSSDVSSCSLLRKHSAFMCLRYFCEYKIHARALTFIYPSSNVCSNRNDRSIDPTRERPSNKTFFSSRNVCITNYLASIYHIPFYCYSYMCVFLQRIVQSESRIHRRAAKDELFCHQLISPNTISRCNERGIYVWIYFWMRTVYQESSLEILEVHREIIIFIVRLFFYEMQRNLCLLINDAMTRRCYRLWILFYNFKSSFMLSNRFLSDNIYTRTVHKWLWLIMRPKVYYRS